MDRKIPCPLLLPDRLTQDMSQRPSRVMELPENSHWQSPTSLTSPETTVNGLLLYSHYTDCERVVPGLQGISSPKCGTTPLEKRVIIRDLQNAVHACVGKSMPLSNKSVVQQADILPLRNHKQ